jgi:rod shape-determining protein MreD
VNDPRLILRYSLVVIGALVLQVSLFTDLRILDVHPDVMLLVAVCAGATAGPTRGATVGFVAGLLNDLLLPGRMGVAALAFAVTAYAVGVASSTVVRPARWISVGLVTLGSVGGVLLYAALSQLLGQSTLADPRLGEIVGIVAGANALLALPTLAICRWAERDTLRSGLRI